MVSWSRPLQVTDQVSELLWRELFEQPLGHDRRVGHLFDFDIRLQAVEPDTRLGGAENIKGYGGFSTRIKLPDTIHLVDELPSGSTGKADRQALRHLIESREN